MPNLTPEGLRLVSEIAARHGVGVEGLSLHSYTGGCPGGLVLGHASMAEPALERGVQLLARALT